MVGRDARGINRGEDIQIPCFPTSIQNQPVGGRLSHYWRNWELIGADPWLVEVIKSGYKIQFHTMPTLTTSPVPTHLPQDQIRRDQTLKEVQQLLLKGVIEEVRDPASPGFYSRFFIVPKATPGKWRSILDLSQLNSRFVKTEKFKMDTAEKVREGLHQGEWLTSIDLMDAYFHVLIHPSSRKYLRFCINEQVYQFRALVMGLSPSPQVFTTVDKAPLAFVQRLGVKLRQYLDDWLVHGTGEERVRQHTRFVVAVAQHLGFLVNEVKSELEPKQVMVFLGYLFDLVEGLVKVTQGRWEKLQGCILPFIQDSTSHKTALEWQTLIGLLISTEKMVRLGMLHVRPIQLAFQDLWSQKEGDQRQLLPVSREVKQALQWWTVEDNVRSGVPLQEPKPEIQVFTDASLDGWGGHLDFQVAQGSWDPHQRKLHINVLEMMAVQKVLEFFLSQVTGKTVLVATDNLTVVYYIRRQGGTRSREMMTMTQELFQFLEQHAIQLRARHIAGKLNVLADSLSREGKVIPTEWSLHPGVLDDLWTIWDKPHVDLFATRFNAKMSAFYSPFPDPRAVGVDALSARWEAM